MPTLLIIDDTESVRESLRHVFARRGYQVVVAEGGLAGLELHAKGGIDAALIDINMPGINGVETCRLMTERISPSGQKTPVWLMTGAIGNYAESAALAAGALAILHKPFDVVAFARELDARLAEIGSPSRIVK